MTTTLNSLARASSAYLRSAMHKPILWHEWGEEAFATARRENKPMLLDIGAVWCHWCHVMDRESYDAPEVAAIANEHLIAVKVDRDERTDIDSRYQIAVQLNEAIHLYSTHNRAPVNSCYEMKTVSTSIYRPCAY
jgi:uncharacterized protein